MSSLLPVTTSRLPLPSSFRSSSPSKANVIRYQSPFPFLMLLAAVIHSFLTQVPLHLAPTLPPTCPVLGISGDQWFSKEVLPIPGGILKMYEVFGLFSKVVVPQHLYWNLYYPVINDLPFVFLHIVC